LIDTPIRAMSNSAALGQRPPGITHSRPIAHASAMTKFAAGPAAATHSMSRFGWRRLPKFTGTGFAQPKIHGGPPNAAAAAIIIPGTSNVPTGSMCRNGLSEIRPSLSAVRSPKLRAA
jgi:hypothetical protein